MATFLTHRSSSARAHSSLTHYAFAISVRTFAKRNIPRGRKRKRREQKDGLPRKAGTPAMDLSRTRTLTAQPWGPPRYPVPRVEQTSVEYAQNLNSLCQIAQHKLQCLGLSVSSYNHASKAAVERLDHYAAKVSQCSPYLHLYQLVVVDDILGYSRDIGSRNTFWIPNDFTVRELIAFLQSECIHDPKLCEVRRIDAFLNPFQPNNWRSIDHLAQLDGSMSYHYNDYKNASQARRSPVPMTEYREVEPVELLKIREKARNSLFAEDHYADSSNYFDYWQMPSPPQIQKGQGREHRVPAYVVPEQSTSGQIEPRSHLEQIDEVEAKLNAKLLQRKQWYLDQLSEAAAKTTDDAEVHKIQSLRDDEFDEASMTYATTRFKRERKGASKSDQ